MLCHSYTGAGHAVYSESLAGDLEGILKQELFMFFFFNHNLMFFKVYIYNNNPFSEVFNLEHYNKK